MRSQKTVKMVEIALMSAVLCVISPFTIPIPMSPVPLSLATFAVYFSAILFGAKRSAGCVLIYLLLGMVGLPVFSGFSGGVGVLLGPTGGYLIGYVPCALLVGCLGRGKKEGSGKEFTRSFAQSAIGHFVERKFVKYVLAMIIGTFACYIFGTMWFLLVMKGSYTITQALLVCVVPYLFFDFIKILAAAAIAEPVGQVLRNRE